MLQLNLFGRFSLVGSDGGQISLKSKKAVALLAYLALSPGNTRSREEIMALLWSDRGEAQARASLRQLIFGLKNSLNSKAKVALNISSDAVSLNPEFFVVENGNEELLSGFHLNDPAFEEWLRDERLRQEKQTESDDQVDQAIAQEIPSIAVLPFTNLSGDPEQEYFADGITEDIVTSLAKTPKLFVIDRDSTLKYKGKTYVPGNVGQEQGVRYLLEGSVRHSGNRLRISAKLIDTVSGQHLWADRYDRVFEDVFELQDEITREIILALRVKLTDGERARMTARGTNSFEAWELVFQAGALLNNHDKEDTEKARRLIEKALKIDERYAMAHVFIGWAHWMDAHNGWTDEPEWSLNQAWETVKRAKIIDPYNDEIPPLLAMIHISNQDYDQAEKEIHKAMSAGPNNSKALAIAAAVANYCGMPEQAISLIERAMRLCPVYYAWFPGVLAEAYFFLGELENAKTACQTSLICDPSYIHANVTLTVTLAEMNKLSEAREVAANILKIDPGFSIAIHMRGQVFRKESYNLRITNGLRAAGLSE